MKGGGAQRSEDGLEINVENRIWREKKEENLRVLREKGRKRPHAPFKLGGDAHAELSWNVLLELNLANQSASAI